VSRAAAQQISFADFELTRQGISRQKLDYVSAFPIQLAGTRAGAHAVLLACFFLKMLQIEKSPSSVK